MTLPTTQAEALFRAKSELAAAEAELAEATTEEDRAKAAYHAAIQRRSEVIRRHVQAMMQYYSAVEAAESE